MTPALLLYSNCIWIDDLGWFPLSQARHPRCQIIMYLLTWCHRCQLNSSSGKGFQKYRDRVPQGRTIHFREPRFAKKTCLSKLSSMKLNEIYGECALASAREIAARSIRNSSNSPMCSIYPKVISCRGSTGEEQASFRLPRVVGRAFAHGNAACDTDHTFGHDLRNVGVLGNPYV